MAIDLGSSNTTRYYSVPDHADFTLPNGDWAWIALIYNQGALETKYVISTGSYGGAASFNLIVYDTTSIGVRVDSIAERLVSVSIPIDKWYWIYGTRRSGNYYCGVVPVGSSSVTESLGTGIASAYNSATGPNIGRRSDGTANRHWIGRIGQVAFVSGAGITSAQDVELANGASLLSMPFAANIKALWHGRNASSATLVDLVGGHVATKQGATYGTSEEDVQTPYIWTPSIVGAAASVSSPIPVFINHYRNQGIM